MNKLTQQQKLDQSLSLTPAQIQAIKMLELTGLELEARIERRIPHSKRTTRYPSKKAPTTRRRPPIATTKTGSSANTLPRMISPTTSFVSYRSASRSAKRSPSQLVPLRLMSI